MGAGSSKAPWGVGKGRTCVPHVGCRSAPPRTPRRASTSRPNPASAACRQHQLAKFRSDRRRQRDSARSARTARCTCCTCWWGHSQPCLRGWAEDADGVPDPWYGRYGMAAHVATAPALLILRFVYRYGSRPPQACSGCTALGAACCVTDPRTRVEPIPPHRAPTMPPSDEAASQPD